MSTYTPIPLFQQASLGTSASSGVYTPSGVTGVIRTIHIQTAATGMNFSMSFGTDGAGTRTFDAYNLTQGIPSIFHGWYPVLSGVPVNLFCNSATVSGGLYGYEFD